MEQIAEMQEKPGRVSRRRFASMLAAGAAGLAIAGAGVHSASAGRAWCRFDPVVMIDGQLADIFIGSDLRMLTSATGPIKITVSIPEGSKGYVILTDLGFGRGYDIDFVTASDLQRSRRETEVRVDVYAPARDSSLPVSVTFAPRSLNNSLKEILFGMTAEGNANEWVTLVP